MLRTFSRYSFPITDTKGRATSRPMRRLALPAAITAALSCNAGVASAGYLYGPTQTETVGPTSSLETWLASDGAALTVSDGGVVQGAIGINGGSIRMESGSSSISQGHGVSLNGASADITGATIVSALPGGGGLVVALGNYSGSSATVSNSTISGSFGVILQGETSDVHIAQSAITSKNAGLYGMNGGYAELADTTIQTTGDAGQGFAMLSGSRVNARSVSISTSGINATGIMASDADTEVTFTDGSIRTTGANARGVFSRYDGALVTIAGSQI
ncbi:hypothetical protein [Achromobacter xylosoxidans]|uniref:hypothetical protein n=1 Tax=Alcaligenes xylosoxydans xylosoxydans TaxID=85698 RepID=UPI001F13F32E|nr:hypothetical protein [Achromobacter xylosoxidans]